MLIRTNKCIDYKDFVSYSDTYIESGSCAGGSIDKALPHFKQIKSIEAHPYFYNFCKDKYKNNKNVQLFFGKSTDHWKQMLEGTERNVLLLDAHPSGTNTAGHEDLIKNGANSEFSQDTIIHKELEIIFSHRNDHIIIIDDLNFQQEAGYKSFCDQILKTNPQYKFYVYDEQRGNEFYKDKFLVAIPE